jgi:hypothetical protein
LQGVEQGLELAVGDQHPRCPHAVVGGRAWPEIVCLDLFGDGRQGGRTTRIGDDLDIFHVWTVAV